MEHGLADGMDDAAGDGVADGVDDPAGDGVEDVVEHSMCFFCFCFCVV